ncbi:hypothetical protein F511_20645 [Dorcoceras hygrometricum]|uniref:Uncharacterized protein n=1 Tax=Dorcoceras hygrometricum TaxID=472368 RepID=A0A2Z7D6E3_9LAMI|nr:hypothetical protein F511_20645 [Dorcoceras hygrometricum]
MPTSFRLLNFFVVLDRVFCLELFWDNSLEANNSGFFLYECKLDSAEGCHGCLDLRDQITGVVRRGGFSFGRELFVRADRFSCAGVVRESCYHTRADMCLSMQSDVMRKSCVTPKPMGINKIGKPARSRSLSRATFGTGDHSPPSLNPGPHMPTSFRLKPARSRSLSRATFGTGDHSPPSLNPGPHMPTSFRLSRNPSHFGVGSVHSCAPSHLEACQEPLIVRETSGTGDHSPTSSSPGPHMC